MMSIRSKFHHPRITFAVLCATAFALSGAGLFADDADGTTIPSKNRRTNASSTSTKTTARKTAAFPGSKYNLHVLATESLVNRMLAQADTEAGVVNDFILGAKVNGWHSTDTNLTVDFKPNRRYAQIDFKLSGRTRTETIGTTDQAMVDTLGQHSFASTKSVFFDGQKLLTRRAITTVSANNINRGVRTSYSGLPLLGDIAEQRAREQIAASRPTTQRIAAQRVVARVNPRFNAELDRQLLEGNQKIRQLVAKWLTPQGLEPDHTYSTTSETYLRYSSSIMGKTLPVDTPIPGDRPHGRALSVYIHESLFEQFANRMNLKGMEVSDRMLQAFIKRLGGETTDPSNSADETGAAGLYSLVFDTQRPMFVEAKDDQLSLVLRFAVKPVVGDSLLKGLTGGALDEVMADARPLPMQRLSIPLSVKPGDQMLAINPGTVSVVAAKQPTSAVDGEDGEEDAAPATDFTGKLIQAALQQKLKALSLPGSFDLPLSNGRSVRLTIKKAVTKNGWLMLAID